jgi:RNA polymerase sigma-70 factor (ECF subfamily)
MSTEISEGRPDEAWLEEARHHPEAFAELVRRYQDRVYALAYRFLRNHSDAEDVAQETFLRAFRALGSFETGRRFAPWLFRIATNLCLDMLRARRPIASLEDDPVPPASLERVEATVDVRERWRALQAALETLPEGLRVVFLLRHESDLSYQEIAQVLGIPVNTVRTRLFRARELLRDRLKGWL